MITILILLAALGVLIWGFRRARPYGKVGVLAWLQSVVLMAPWLLFFGLSAAGIYINLLTILLLIVSSAGLYIFLGRQLRTEGQNPSMTVDSSAQSEFRADKPIVFQEASENSTQSTAEAFQPQAPEQSVDQAPDEADKTNQQTEKATDDAASPADSTQKPSVPAMPEEDRQAVRGIFGIDTFYVTESVPYQEGVIFKGNLRGNPETVHQVLSAALAERMGDRYRLYAVEGMDDKPVMVVLPTSSDPKPTTPFQWVTAVVLAIATVATCLETASILQGFDFFRDLDRFQETLLVGGGIISILVFREVGHWVQAQRYHLRLSPPFFIPTWQIGSFGSFIRFESVLPDRSVLFDVAIAGSLFGGLLSLVFLIIGLLLSHQGSLFQVPTEFFQGSIFVGTLARVVLGNQIQQPIVDIHPLTIVGWLGLVITALNTMPAGQLDGGRIVQSIYGRKVARRATIATLIVLGIVTLVNPLALYWAIVILFLQRDLERPSLNELTEPNDTRAALGLLVLFLMAAILLPLTPGLAGRLGIGG
jgi:membrane-associated protease RseP (regulator of RpoE activity)